MALLLLSTAADRSPPESPTCRSKCVMPPRDNPMGLDGFEFVEFTSPDPEALARMFGQLGFTHVGSHRSKAIHHYCQGDIHFLLNMAPQGHAAEFRGAHGPSACA